MDAINKIKIGDTVYGIGHTGVNLLDNWDFRNPVNQRNATGTIGTAGYFVDRWELVSGSVTIGTSGLTINGVIRQKLENAAGTNVTTSSLMASGTATCAYDNSTKYFTVTSSGGIVQAIKLELGSVSTLANDAPADYTAELRKCQRYFYRIGNVNSYGVLPFLCMTDGTPTLLAAIPTPVPMRVRPTVTQSGLRVNGIWQPVTSISMSDFSGTHINAAIGVASGLVANTVYVISGNPAGYITLSADL